mgnify:CR=1 FL=1
MSIIDQLEQTVTPAVLGERNSSESVAYISLLEQFYAILAARLAVPQVYSQLLRNDQVIANDNIPEMPLFKQLWHSEVLQNTIIQELSATHHIDESVTAQLLINAAPLAYRELKTLANGQFLPAFLQAEQPSLRPYLPIWAIPVITSTLDVDNKSNVSQETSSAAMADNSIGPLSDNTSITLDRLDDPSLNTSTVPTITAAATTASDGGQPRVGSTDGLGEETRFGSDDAIHASPAAHHLAENGSLKREQVRTRNQRNDLLIRVFLSIVALAGLALAAWALLIKPNNDIPVEPIAAAPVITAPAPEPVVEAMTPVEFIIGVDDSGNLYTCSATVGDVGLQSTLQQALNTSFGEQADICELTVQDGTATTIANMSVDVLPNVLTMLRSTPFARLQLQNERLIVEAPDNMLLQQLVTNIRSLVPAMAVDSTAPLPLPNNNAAYGMGSADGVNNQFGGGAASNNQYSNDGTGNGSVEYQAPDDNTSDRVIPAPLPNNSNNRGLNNNPSSNNPNSGLPNIPSNSPSSMSNNIPSNAPSNNRTSRSSGPISESEVDDMASSVIVAEPAQVR